MQFVFSKFLQDFGKKEVTKREYISYLEGEINNYYQQMVYAAFLLLRNDPKYSEINGLYFPHNILITDRTIRNKIDMLLSACVDKAIENDHQMREIINRVDNVKLNYTGSIVWGAIIGVLGLMFCNNTFLYLGLIPVAIGIVKIICGIRNKIKSETEIKEIDKMVEQADDYFYATCMPEAYNVNNYIAEHLNYF